MRAEIRADGLHISGYVNVPGRFSRPVMTARGRVIETIDQGAFRAAIERAEDIHMLRDHDSDYVLADANAGTLRVKEDAVGLRAEAVIVDQKTIDDAKAGKIRGWSFNMRNIRDDIETRAEGLPLRTVHAFDMDEISLVIDRVPVYSSTSVEMRADSEEDVEMRAETDDVELIVMDDTEDHEDPAGEEPDGEPEDPADPEEDLRRLLAEYLARIEALRL